MITRILFVAFVAGLISLASKCSPSQTVPESNQARNYEIKPVQPAITASLPERLPLPELRIVEQTPAGRQSHKLSRLLGEISNASTDLSSENRQIALLFQQFQSGFEQLNAMSLNQTERGEVRDYLHAAIHQSTAEIRAHLDSQEFSEQVGQVRVELALMEEYMMQL